MIPPTQKRAFGLNLSLSSERSCFVSTDDKLFRHLRTALTNGEMPFTEGGSCKLFAVFSNHSLQNTSFPPISMLRFSNHPLVSASSVAMSNSVGAIQVAQKGWVNFAEPTPQLTERRKDTWKINPNLAIISRDNYPFG